MFFMNYTTTKIFYLCPCIFFTSFFSLKDYVAYTILIHIIYTTFYFLSMFMCKYYNIIISFPMSALGSFLTFLFFLCRLREWLYCLYIFGIIIECFTSYFSKCRSIIIQLIFRITYNIFINALV